MPPRQPSRSVPPSPRRVAAADRSGMPRQEPGTQAATRAENRIESRPRAALPALCVTQITSWGILYYAFPCSCRT